MKTKIIFILLCLSISSITVAVEISDQEYINQLNYKNNKLSLVVKERLVDEKRSYSHTDIDTTSSSFEAYYYTSSDIDTTSLSRAEAKEVTDWFIYKGRVRKLSDSEFLALIGDRTELARVLEIEAEKARWRTMGNIGVGSGILLMLGGTAFSAGQAIITGGALAMTAGFFCSAFNQPPAHYIQPDYAQQKIDEYNIALKRKLGLPINFE